MKQLIGLTMASTVVLTGALVSIPADAQSATAHHAAAVHDRVGPSVRGTEVFRALFFLQGGQSTRDLLRDAHVSTLTEQEIDEVLDAMSTADAKLRVAQIEQELRSTDPLYFERLGRSVQSADPRALQHHLSSAYEQMLRTPTMAEAVRSLEAQDTYVPGEIGTDCGVAVVVALGAVIAVTAVAAVNYALAANIAVGWNVVAGTNAVATRSKSLDRRSDDSRFSAGVVAAVIKRFGN